MALRGTLKDFGIADIFQLIGHQGKTGILKVRERTREVEISFREGNVVRATSMTRKERDMLGSLLVRAEIISQQQLTQALEIQKSSKKRLGDILVESGLLDTATLHGFMRLQTHETIYQLFLWNSGTYEFNQAEVPPAEGLEPLRGESVLMEGFRQLDEWPAIRKLITGYAMTFDKREDLEALEAGGAPAGEEDLDFDDAFAEFESGAGSKRTSRLKDIGQNERAVYQLIAPGRDVQKIIDLSRLGEFETCKAMVALLNAKIIEPTAAKDPSATPSNTATLGGISARRTSGSLMLFGRVVLTAALIAGGLFAVQRFLGLEPRRLLGRGGAGFVEQDVQAVLSAAQVLKIERALAVYQAETGALPEALDSLVEAGLLRSVDLRYPWQQPYHYARAGTGYELLRPLF